MKLGAGVSELHLVIGDSGLGGEVIGFGGVQGFADVGIVEGGKQLACADVRAFVEENADDATGDFCGDGGATARGSLAAGVQECFAAAEAGSGLLRDGDFDNGFLVPKCVDAAGETGDYD